MLGFPPQPGLAEKVMKFKNNFNRVPKHKQSYRIKRRTKFEEHSH